MRLETLQVRGMVQLHLVQVFLLRVALEGVAMAVVVEADVVAKARGLRGRRELFVGDVVVLRLGVTAKQLANAEVGGVVAVRVGIVNSLLIPLE